MAEVIDFNLGSVGDPASSAGHIVRVRGLVDQVYGGSMDLQTELRQSGSALSTPASWNDALTASAQTFTHTLSSAQADAITDYSALQLRFTATQAAPSAPSIVAVGAPAFTATNGATIAPGLPAGFAADDIHVMIAARSDNTAMTSLANWTNIAGLTSNNTAAQRVEIWWRRAVGGDAAPTVTFGSGTVVRGAVIIGIRGCVTSGSPFDTNSSLSPNAASATVTFTDVSSTVVNTRALALLAYEDDPTTLSNMGSFTQPTGAVSTSSLGNDMMLGIESRSVASIGSVGASTLTVSGGTFANSPNVGIILVLKPANNSRARVTWAELQVPVSSVAADTPEIRGRPAGLRGERQMTQLIAQ